MSAEMPTSKWLTRLHEESAAKDAEITALKARVQKLETALRKLECVSSENHWVRKLVAEALEGSET